MPARSLSLGSQRSIFRALITRTGPVRPQPDGAGLDARRRVLHQALLTSWVGAATGGRSGWGGFFFGSRASALMVGFGLGMRMRTLTLLLITLTVDGASRVVEADSARA